MSAWSSRIALKVTTTNGRRKTVCHFRKWNPAELPAGHASRAGGGLLDNRWHVTVQAVRVRQFEPKESEFFAEYYKYARDGAAIRGLPVVEESTVTDDFTFLDAGGKKMFSVNRATLTTVLDRLAGAGHAEIDLDMLRRALGRT